MAHKKGAGTSRNGRDSNPKYRGVKRHDGNEVNAGEVLVRQKGTKVHAGPNVGMGKDFTLFALIAGKVRYEKFQKGKTRVSVLSPEEVARSLAAQKTPKAATK